MKSPFCMMMISLVGCATFTFPAPAADEESDQGLDGTWHGALITDYVGSPRLPLTHLRVILNIEKNSDGHYTGVLDSPDERFAGAPLSDITLDDNHFHFQFELGKAVFDGRYDTDKNEMRGRKQLGSPFAGPRSSDGRRSQSSRILTSSKRSLMKTRKARRVSRVH